MVQWQVLTEDGVTFWRVLPVTPDPSVTTYSALHLFYEQTLRKTEVRFRLNLEGQSTSNDLVMVIATGRENVSQVRLEIYIDSTNRAFILKDAVSGRQTSAPYSSGWMKAVLAFNDSEGGEAMLLDDAGNTMATLQLSPGAGTGSFQRFFFSSRYESAYKSVPDVHYITMTYDSKPPLFDQSGLDPNDPTWAPPDGWTEVHHLDSVDDAWNAFTSYSVGGIANSLMCFSSDVNDYASAYVDRPNTFYRKVAIAAKFIRASFATTDTYIAEFFSDKAKTNGIWFNLYTDASTQSIKLVDNNNPGQPMTVPVPSDWFVLVAEVLDSGGVVRLYDRDKNLIGEYTLQPDIHDYDYFYFKIDARNRYQTDDVWSLVMDWIAFKEEPKEFTYEWTFDSIEKAETLIGGTYDYVEWV